MADAPLLSLDGLTKRFGDLVANDSISFDVRAGEIHGLVGENGAGKSTLVKSLYGVHRAEEGTISIDGRAVDITSPAKARAAGIGMVFQDMRIVPAMTVWENVALYLAEGGDQLRPRRVQQDIRDASERWGLGIDPMATVRDLSIGEWQRTELVKVLLGGARVLILDEPTSVLTPQEVDALFAIVRGLAAEGVGVVLIAHKIREVRAIADRLTVLRGGRVVMANVEPAEVSDKSLVMAMVGQDVDEVRRRPRNADLPAEQKPLVQLRGATVRRAGGDVGLDAVALDIFPSEVLGVAGIAGNGQGELADLLAGLAPLEHGTATFDGEAISALGPRGLRRAGVVDVVANPSRQFVVQGLTIAEHEALWTSSAAGGRLRRFARRANSERFSTRNTAASLRAAHPGRRMDQLSGGNVQRVVLTLALTSSARLAVVSYPTRGLDVLTADRAHTLLAEARDAGASIVLISEDLDELLALSDRILVLAGGKVAGLVDANAATRESLGQLMTAGAA